MILIDLDQKTALWTRLLGVSPLCVARIDDPWIGPQHGAFMDMAKRPVAIAARRQFLQGTGRIAVVIIVAGERRVQKPDVEIAGQSRRIGGGEIVGDRSGFETLAVD